MTASSGASIASHPTLEPFDEHNRRLVENVHPPGWRNPEPAERYHLVAIGAGTAGLVSAIVTANLGGRAALVERHLMGGDCLIVGCVPSKGLIAASRALQRRELGSLLAAPRPESEAFARAMERVRRLRADISPHDSARRFAEAGVDVFLGHGRFVARDEIEVDGKRLRFRRAVIATGARAAAPPIPGLEDVDYLTNESVFSLTERPDRLLVIGAGPIGCELAQAFAGLGSQVTLFDVAEQVLIREDPNASAIVATALERDGVALHLGAKIERIERRGGDTVVVFEHKGARQEAAGDQLLVAVGRRPNIEDLGLETAGVEHGKDGVTVDDRLRTANPKIYAAGDITRHPKFTHLADAHAAIVIQNALFFGRRKASDLVVPWCTYTSPEVAHVGLYEHEAKDRGVPVDVVQVPFSGNDRALLDGEDEGFVKLVLAKGTDRILGATVVAHHAGDLLAPLCLAVTHRIGLGKFAATIFPYPTQAEALKKAANQWRKRKLSPLVQRVFRAWFRLTSKM
jgi:pyruvate/2-oxoglutarate dehydrogenase complex dihydrolipoamide dehydrogenase (E3) component